MDTGTRQLQYSYFRTENTKDFEISKFNILIENGHILLGSELLQNYSVPAMKLVPFSR